MIFLADTNVLSLFDYIPVASITESAFALNADPRIIEIDIPIAMVEIYREWSFWVSFLCIYGDGRTCSGVCPIIWRRSHASVPGKSAGCGHYVSSCECCYEGNGEKDFLNHCSMPLIRVGRNFVSNLVYVINVVDSHASCKSVIRPTLWCGDIIHSTFVEEVETFLPSRCYSCQSNRTFVDKPSELRSYVAAAQVLPVNPAEVATISEAAIEAMTAITRKNFLIIFLYPYPCRAQLLVRYLTFMNSFHWR